MFEKKYPDVRTVIDRLCSECRKESIILGIFLGDEFRGLAELYGFRDPTASTMVENQASANVLRKNGFRLVVHEVGEDWGYGSPTIADKWIR